jgi:YHS domain-containing protein
MGRIVKSEVGETPGLPDHGLRPGAGNHPPPSSVLPLPLVHFGPARLDARRNNVRWSNIAGALGRAAVVAVALSLSTTLVAAQALNTDKSGVAVSGYDPVAYFSQTTALKGSPQITATHGGATYYFSSTANRDVFLANPDKYAPVYGGYCAYGVAKGHKVSIDPEAFRVVDGKLYLNHDKSVQEKWLADIPGNIAQAERTWPALKDAPRD